MTVCLGGGRERHSGRYDTAAEGAGPIGNGRSGEHHRPGVDREDRAGLIPGDGQTVRTQPNDVHLGSRGIQRAQRAAQLMVLGELNWKAMFPVPLELECVIAV